MKCDLIGIKKGVKSQYGLWLKEIRGQEYTFTGSSILNDSSKLRCNNQSAYSPYVILVRLSVR